MYISDEGIRRISVGINNITPWDPSIAMKTPLVGVAVESPAVIAVTSILKSIKTVTNNNDNK